MIDSKDIRTGVSDTRVRWHGTPASWRHRLCATAAATLAAGFIPLLMLLSPRPAYAVDGCKLLLCISGDWKSIPLCGPVVREALHDIAKGKGWPTCDMGGTDNNGYFSWTNQSTCPPFYSQYNPDSGTWRSCNYAGVVSVRVSGKWWADVFVDVWGLTSAETSTHYSDAARTQLGSRVDPRYDLDAAVYMTPPAPVSGGVN